MRRAVYAGSFDPITNGHLWMIEAGSKLFDELVIAAGVNSSKKYSFSLAERLKMLKACTKKYKNVKTDNFEGQFLVKYAKSINADYILRGIRTSADYEYERTLSHVNLDIEKGVTMVFLVPPIEISDISSSMVKDLVGSAGWEKLKTSQALIITVGDETTKTLLRYEMEPGLAIFDLKTHRQTVSHSDLPKHFKVKEKVENPQKEITYGLWQAIANALKTGNSKAIEVAGEEDLAALPCAYLAPEGSIVIYGIPNVGLNLIEVDSGIKSKAESLMAQMELVKVVNKAAKKRNGKKK